MLFTALIVVIKSLVKLVKLPEKFPAYSVEVVIDIENELLDPQKDETVLPRELKTCDTEL